MFHIAAYRSTNDWSGEVGQAKFDTIQQAEAEMRKWARFGVDGYCNDADTILLADGTGRVLKVWDWRARRPVEVDEDGNRVAPA